MSLILPKLAEDPAKLNLRAKLQSGPATLPTTPAEPLKDKRQTADTKCPACGRGDDAKKEKD